MINSLTESISSYLILAYLFSSVLFIIGIKLLGRIKSARRGNFYASLGMLLAIMTTLMDRRVVSVDLVISGVLLGSAAGIILAKKIQMTEMPQMVALLNGFGGISSLLVASSQFYINPETDSVTGLTIWLSVFLGGITFTGSLIAFLKLQGVKMIRGSVVYPLQHTINLTLILVVIVLGGYLNIQELQSLFAGPSMSVAFLALIIISLLLGKLLVLPIGGADMPVVISLLNSYSGLAAATTGFVLRNNVLIITGAIVGASGIILTTIMCKSMNRSLLNVLLGGFGMEKVDESAAGESAPIVVKEVDTEETAMLFESATSVIIVPGYGMAVAQAQHAVRELTDLLLSRNVSVKFAIHPVAGRMPGHMNVLLAEANIDYDLLYEMERINDDFSNTDIALVIGANDVTNPAARHTKSSPIYGMPILNVDRARTVIVIKRSLNPGYAGIENELYGYPNTVMYFGDAKDAIARLTAELKEV